MKPAPQPFENYPARTVLIVWLVNLIVYLASVYLIWRLGALWGVLAIVYLFVVEFSTYWEGCTHCYYYGKRCYSGRGRIAPWLVKKGNPQKFCEKPVTFWNLLPHALVSIAPLIVGIILLIQDFNWLILICTSLPLLQWFMGNQLIFGILACPHCEQGRRCCPAQAFFGKKKNLPQHNFFMTLIIIFFILGLILLSWALAGLSLAPWVPVRTRDLERIFRLAQLQPGQTFYDLGSGTGKIVFYAARHFSVQAVGIEFNWLLFFTSRLRQLFFSSKNITFEYGNLFSKNLAAADVAYVFGMPQALKNRLAHKLAQELRPGARVISYVFPIADWTPQVVDKPSEEQVAIYLYQI